MSTEFGIFQSIIEGDQAETYKKNKIEQKNKEFYANRDRMDRRRDADSDPKSTDDALRKSKSEYLSRSMMKKTGRNNYDDYVNAKDATSRHLRRHPELNESTIEFV